MAKKQKFYITTSIMYVNSDPHLGFAWELVQADVLARYRRLKGDKTFFLTGADEHGKKIYETAQNLGIDTQKFVDEKSQRIKDLALALDVTNDFFIRTTDKKNHRPSVEKIWKLLEKNGDIYKKEYEGLYCLGCEAFKTERELQDGKCPIHMREPEIIKEENYFFKLSNYLKSVKKIIETGKIKIHPEGRKYEVLNMIKEGIDDLSVSRPKSEVPWGIPVPSDDSQNIYVWFEALLNYISALEYSKSGAKSASGRTRFKTFWPADVHLIGKDILKFHTIIWPAILFAAGLRLPKTVLVHGFITSGGVKMSKSLGNVVDPFGVIEKYGSDAFRYYFLSESSIFSDPDYTEQKFMARYNSDLSHGLGNLVNRILNIAKKNEFLLKGLAVDSDGIEKNKFRKRIWKDYVNNLEKYDLDKSLEVIWQFITHNNQMVETVKLWELPKTDAKEFKNHISEFIENLVFIAWMIQPFMPQSSDKIFKMIGLKKTDRKSWKSQKVKIGEIKPLFPKIESRD